MVRQFDSTAWSVVMAAQGTQSTVAKAALEALCATYWPPLYTYVRLKGHSREDAEDLTQEFFCRLLARDFLHDVNSERGRFRTFLLACMDHFLRDEWRKSIRAKRGGRTGVLAMDFAAGEECCAQQSSLGADPCAAFDRQWAESLLDAAFARLRAEYDHAGKGALLGALGCYVLGGGRTEGYARAAAELGMSEGAVKVAVHRMRRRLAEMTRREIADTVEHDVDVEEELAYLLRVLST